ncbi:hypothetical protein [Marinobacter salexigens]|uniref:hypothetical protein n=1 Tax=Marinobacter salexigens TaxID=1925763 RepID=UPI000C285D4D|nr:hypothetical protein [Marinobacter salexigens]
MSNSKIPARQLGELMCNITEQVLWQPAAAWVTDRVPGSKLVCRVGSGQATYHRFAPQRKQHQITYGLRMIQAKHHPATASGWLSSREIHRRGYFDGELNTLNLLAHTCCHEFAHLLQHSAGHRFPGSVHNRHFYNILDGLHENGEAGAVREVLAMRAEQQGIDLPQQSFDMPDTNKQKAAWKVGEAVAFNHGLQEFQGEITRVNRKTCTVDGTGKSRGVRYRVPMQMLRRTS